MKTTRNSVPGALNLRATSERGKGVFAGRWYRAGDPILEFQGPRLAPDEVEDFAFAIQIGPELFLGPSGDFDDFVNHSCDPCCGLMETEGRLLLIAIRTIEPEEELTFDYSTSMRLEPWTLSCQCGSPRCRRVIRAYPSLPPDLRRRYEVLGIVPRHIRSGKDSAQ